MVVRGEPWMIPALSRIWEICFGDSPEYIRFFMERRFPTSQSFVWLEQGEPVGVAYLLPCMIGGYQAYYGYAIGVHPSVQRRGICAELLKNAEHFCNQHEAIFFLVPRPGIENYYIKRGFQPAFYYNVKQIIPQRISTEKLVIENASSEEYLLLRDRCFQSHGYVSWSLNAVTYALEEQRLCGGFAHVLYWGGERYLLFGNKEGEMLHLRESTLAVDMAEKLSPWLCNFYNVSEIMVEYPSPSSEKGIPRGCCYDFTLHIPGWLALDLT